MDELAIREIETIIALEFINSEDYIIALRLFNSLSPGNQRCWRPAMEALNSRWHVWQFIQTILRNDWECP